MFINLYNCLSVRIMDITKLFGREKRDLPSNSTDGDEPKNKPEVFKCRWWGVRREGLYSLECVAILMNSLRNL